MRLCSTLPIRAAQALVLASILIGALVPTASAAARDPRYDAMLTSAGYRLFSDMQGDRPNKATRSAKPTIVRASLQLEAWSYINFQCTGEGSGEGTLRRVTFHFGDMPGWYMQPCPNVSIDALPDFDIGQQTIGDYRNALNNWMLATEASVMRIAAGGPSASPKVPAVTAKLTRSSTKFTHACTRAGSIRYFTLKPDLSSSTVRWNRCPGGA
jgi:hypothetical protein